MIDKNAIVNSLDIPAELLDELLADYKMQALKTLADIQCAFEQQDYTRIAALAHSLKGVSGNLRLESAAQAARLVEQAAKDNPLELQNARLITSLGNAIDELLAYI